MCVEHRVFFIFSLICIFCFYLFITIIFTTWDIVQSRRAGHSRGPWNAFNKTLLVFPSIFFIFFYLAIYFIFKSFPIPIAFLIEILNDKWLENHERGKRGMRTSRKVPIDSAIYLFFSLFVRNIQILTFASLVSYFFFLPLDYFSLSVYFVLAYFFL